MFGDRGSLGFADLPHGILAPGVTEKHHREGQMLFALGDYCFGVLLGIVTTLAVRVLVEPGMDMVIAMLLGMAAGMVLHAILGVLVAPLLGMFQTMIPAAFIGMYGGMLFGMRDSMNAGSTTLGSAVLVGAVFGALVVLGVKAYDAALRGVALDAER
jgi:membrane glycosyltransferase